MAPEATPGREERLGARLRERDPEALRDVHDRCGRMVFGFLVKALGDRGVAEDVQQQVFLEVWRRCESFDPRRGTLLTWVMTIARSRAIDQLRRRVPRPLDPESAAATIDSEAGEDRIDELVEQWRMRGLLDRLPENEAVLLQLRFYGGLSQSEIAAREEIPLGTVKTRMFNGLGRLREMIEAEEGR
ncbi:MAG TPA: sigma-70 family RNA polymerase sigma factor [Solirubrobacterales bacterium]